MTNDEAGGLVNLVTFRLVFELLYDIEACVEPLSAL